MDLNNNYLLLFKISIQESYSFKGWADFNAKANEETNKHRPKSTLASPAQKARYQTFLDKAKELETKANNGVSFAEFIQSQRQEMLAFQADKTEEIKRILRFCDAEKLKSPDLVKALCAEYAPFQITEDVILSLIKTVSAESGSGDGDFSDYLSKADAKAIETALLNAGRENDSLYEVLETRENAPIGDLQNQANKFYESARKSNDSTLSSLFGQCLKIFKTAESKQKYDNYLKISKYKKTNSDIETLIRLTGVTSIQESNASKIITQAVIDYPELSRAQAGQYIKGYCEYWGYKVTIAATEFIQVAPPPRPAEKDDKDNIDKLLRNAEDMFKKAKDFERAKKLYEEIINLAPTNPFGWLGMASIITNDFSIFTKDKIQAAQTYATKALNVATADDTAKVQSKWNAYVNTFKTKQNEYRRRISENEKQHGILLYRNNELADDIKLYKNGKSGFRYVLWLLMKIAYAAIIALALFGGLLLLSDPVLDLVMDFSFFIEFILGLVWAAITFGLPPLTFVLLIKKFTKKKISKKTQQKIMEAEKEILENQRAMERLKQENARLQSYL